MYYLRWSMDAACESEEMDDRRDHFQTLEAWQLFID
jgi:hypothetical protein